MGGGALLLLLFLCFIKPIKLYQTRLVRLHDLRLARALNLIDGSSKCDSSQHSLTAVRRVCSIWTTCW